MQRKPTCAQREDANSTLKGPQLGFNLAERQQFYLLSHRAALKTLHCDPFLSHIAQT